MFPPETVSGLPALEQPLAPAGWSDPIQIPHLSLSQHITFQHLLVWLLSCQPTTLAMIIYTNTNPKQPHLSLFSS